MNTFQILKYLPKLSTTPKNFFKSTYYNEIKPSLLYRAILFGFTINCLSSKKKFDFLRKEKKPYRG